MPYQATLIETVEALMGGPETHGYPTHGAFVFCLVPVLMWILLNDFLPTLERNLEWKFRTPILDEDVL